MALRSAAALFILLGATAASADGPPLRVLASSGSVIDDLPIARFDRPGRLRDGRLVFRGESTAVLRTVDGVEHPYVRTGDALAAPLDGTLNEIVDVAVSPRGTIAVAADVNSSQATGVILVDDGTGPTTAVTHAEDADLAGVAIDTAGDLLYWTSAALYVRAGGAPEVIATLPSRGRLRLRPVLADGPAAAWMVDSSSGTSGVSYWSPATGTVTVAGGRFKRTASVRLGLAIDPRFGVAYLRSGGGSPRGAFLWSVSGRTTSKLAAVGDAVGDRSIRRFRGALVFADDGAVAFEADLKGRKTPRNLRTWVRAKDGVLTAIDAPAGPATGFVRLDRRGALFVADGERVAPLLRPGDPIAGGGTVASVESHVAHGDDVAAVVALNEGGEAVVRRRGTRLVALKLEPDAGISFSSPLLEITPRATALLTDNDVFVGRRRLAPAKAPKRIASDFFVQTLVGGDRLFALATSGACDGVFAARGRRLVSVLTAGPAPGCGRRPPLASIEGIAANADAVVALGSDAQLVPGLYRVRHRRVTRLGTEIAGVALAPLAVLLAGDRPLFVAASPGDAEVQQVFLAGSPEVTPLVREGDPTSLGEIGFEAIDVYASGSDEEILLTATVRGGAVRRALVAQPLPR